MSFPVILSSWFPGNLPIRVNAGLFPLTLEYPKIHPNYEFHDFSAKMSISAKKWKFWNFSEFSLITNRDLQPRFPTEISWTCSCGVRFDAVRVDCQEFSSQLNSIFSYRFDQFLRASHFDQFHGPVWSWPRSDHMTCMQQMLICNRILSTSLKYFVKVTIEW